MTRGFARTDEGQALVARTARHFAHKVDVEVQGETTVIGTRFGTAALTPAAGGIELALGPTRDEDRARLQDVLASHLERFARAPLAIEWEEPS